jgi:hypothetical protein
MKKLFIITILMGVCLFSYTQTLNLVMGSTISNESLIFHDKSLSRAPMPFFTIGLGYTHTTNVNVSLAYAFNLRIVTFQASVPLLAFKKKRTCQNFALINNNKKWE